MQVAVNLVKQAGREKVGVSMSCDSHVICPSLYVQLVGDAFEKHVMLMDDPNLTYIAFDFHQST